MDLSGVTEDEVKALFDKDGELRDTPQGNEEETQEEPAEETQENTEEPSEKEGEDATLDWSKLDPRYKSEWEKTQSEAKKWKDDYAKIQSQWTKSSNSWKEKEATLAEMASRVEVLSRWEALLEQNPRLSQVIEAELAKANDPLGNQQIPDELKQNPAFRYLQETYAPHIKTLEQKLQALETKTRKIDEYETQVKEHEARTHLDNQLNAAKEEIKSYFGREATEEEVAKVLEYMVEKKFYDDGALAAMRVFKDQFKESVLRQNNEQMKEKAKKFPARNKSVNSARAATPSKGSLSAEEAIAMALEEQGVTT